MADLEVEAPTQTMQDSFGARMRQHRERQGITIAFIADRTKLKASLIEGFERDDISGWPAGIFRRAWVRAYAEAIGLDPQVVTREFLELHPEPVVDVEPVMDRPARLRSLVGSALGLSRRPRVTAPPSPVITPAIGTSGRAAVAPPPASAPAPSPAPAADAAESTSPILSGPVSGVVGERRTRRSRRSTDAAVDLLAAADLCTELGRVEQGDQILPLLRQAAHVIGARGLIVWIWEPAVGELRPALVHGYSDRVIAQLPPLRRDADNPTAEAFRSARTRTVAGGEGGSAALVVPLLTVAACAGVLAIELPAGVEQHAPVCAVATFLAATLALLLGSAAAEEAPPADGAAQLASSSLAT
jgi:hypothetical protein